MIGAITLRDITESDLPIFFQHQLDPTANHMAAFTSGDPSNLDSFMDHWAKIFADHTIIKKTILYDGDVAGNIANFDWRGKPEIGYWIGREYWGKGIATGALTELLRIVTVRPLFAAAASDNLASIRVLEKCGFKIIGYERAFAKARGEEIEEVLLKLD